jgi:hypothetical protein
MIISFKSVVIYLTVAFVVRGTAAIVISRKSLHSRYYTKHVRIILSGPDHLRTCNRRRVSRNRIKVMKIFSFIFYFVFLLFKAFFGIFNFEVQLQRHSKTLIL